MQSSPSGSPHISHRRISDPTSQGYSEHHRSVLYDADTIYERAMASRPAMVKRERIFESLASGKDEADLQTNEVCLCDGKGTLKRGKNNRPEECSRTAEIKRGLTSVLLMPLLVGSQDRELMQRIRVQNEDKISMLSGMMGFNRDTGHHAAGPITGLDHERQHAEMEQDTTHVCGAETDRGSLRLRSHPFSLLL
jgi:hypothetical protein